MSIENKLCEPDYTQLMEVATQNLPTEPQERDLQGRIFDTRQRLVEKLMRECAPSDATNMTDSLEHEDVWREMLPPLLVPNIRKISPFSAWRSAAVAILGLLFGTALGQALFGEGLFASSEKATELTYQAYQGSGLVALCGLMGAMALLWLTEYLVQGRSDGNIRIFGKKYRWKRFTKLAGMTWLVVLVLAVVRDFFGAKIGIVHLVQAVGAFLQKGLVLPFFTNIYGVLLFCFVLSLLLKRPLAFDHQDFEEKLAMAVRQWWAGASRMGPLLQENIALKNDPTKAAWQKVGVELYSLAGELPEARKDWLESRLLRLGIEATREEGALIWSEDMGERYTILGHIGVGDACYVDEPPVFEQGLLIRKGTVRKVRK